MDSTGFHWIPLDSTGLHSTSLYIWAELHTGTKLDSTGLDWTVSYSQHKTGLHWTGLDSTAVLNTKLDWTASYSQHKTGLHWTPLDCQLLSTQNWTGLDSTAVLNTKLDSTGLD